MLKQNLIEENPLRAVRACVISYTAAAATAQGGAHKLEGIQLSQFEGVRERLRVIGVRGKDSSMMGYEIIIPIIPSIFLAFRWNQRGRVSAS